MKTVTHLAIKHKPPCLKFQYIKSSSTRYHKNIDINLSDCSETLNLVSALAERYPELCQVPNQTLVDLIDELFSSRRQPENKSDDINNIFYSPIKNDSQKMNIASATKNEYEDLNQASDEHVSKAKKKMNFLFEHTLITPGDARYEYDKRIEFEADEESSWD